MFWNSRRSDGLLLLTCVGVTYGGYGRHNLHLERLLKFAKLSEHSYNTCVKAESPYLIAQFKV